MGRTCQNKTNIWLPLKVTLPRSWGQIPIFYY
nr:MAG TPA: hypothetical protein [Caudoviricetes sp.]